MSMRAPLLRILGAAVLGAVIVVVLSIKLNAFRDYQIAEIAVYVTAVAGLTVLTGLSGQISLGNGAFMAIGAYTTALMLAHLGEREASASLHKAIYRVYAEGTDLTGDVGGKSSTSQFTYAVIACL